MTSPATRTLLALIECSSNRVSCVRPREATLQRSEHYHTHLCNGCYSILVGVSLFLSFGFWTRTFGHCFSFPFFSAYWPYHCAYPRNRQIIL